MPIPHQVTHTLATGTTNKTLRLKCQVNPRQPFRRLYLGGYFYGGITDALWTARVRFNGDGSRNGGGEWLFGWKSQISSFVGTVSDFALYQPVPPFNVEEVPTGSAGEFVTTTPCSADEMVIVNYDLDPGAIRLIRMQPIPIYTDAAEIEVLFKCDWSAATETFYGFMGSLGVRSSEVAL